MSANISFRIQMERNKIAKQKYELWITHTFRKWERCNIRADLTIKILRIRYVKKNVNYSLYRRELSFPSLSKLLGDKKIYIFATEYIRILYADVRQFEASGEMFALEKFHCQIRISSREEINIWESRARPQDASVH